MRTRASEVREQRILNRNALVRCAHAKRRLRRDRIPCLYRDLLHQEMVLDGQFVLREDAALRTIDDARAHALDEDAGDGEESMLGDLAISAHRDGGWIEAST